MRPATFPREQQRHAKQHRMPLIRLQVDERHLGGSCIEVCGPGPQMVANAINELIQEWNRMSRQAAAFDIGDDA